MPLYLGVRAVVVKSFARIHVANLINAGILPLTFADPEDYELLAQGDELVLENIMESLDSGEFTLTDTTNSRKIKLRGDFTERQKAMLRAGGLLTYTRDAENRK